MKKPNQNLDLFVLNYYGNKYLETKKHLKYKLTENINDYDIIAEGCCGIFGFTRALFEGELFENLKNNEKVPEIYLNDIDEKLINFYKNLQNAEDGGEAYLKKIYEHAKSFETDADFSKFMREKSKEETDDGYFYIMKLIYTHNVSTVMNTQKGNKKIENYIKNIEKYKLLFKNIKLFSMDILDFYNILPKDKKILFFIDPPYLNSENRQYEGILKNENEYGIIDGTTIFIDIYKILEKKEVDVILVINYISIIEFLYRDFFKQYYNLTYKNKTNNTNNACHAVFTNFDFK